MVKLYRRKIVLVILYGIFIYCTFYVILKTSKRFGNLGFDSDDIIKEKSKENNVSFNDIDDVVNNNNKGVSNENNVEKENYEDNDNNMDEESKNGNDNSNNIDTQADDDENADEEKEKNNKNKSGYSKFKEILGSFRSNKKNKENKSKNKKDLDYILNYKGGEIEPKWNWIRDISIVYTWVDGSDVDFSDVKAKFNGGIRGSNSRDRSADELRYSIRSVEKYMPWHNGTIYIVTSQQIPKWLDTSNKKIKIIYHKDIFPENIYPTYDSNTIEMFFDKIPGITERFIYFNDDVFLNNYIHPCFFFTGKNFDLKIYRNSPRTIDKKDIEKIIAENNIHEIFAASKYFTRKIAREYFDEDFEFCDLFHVPHVYYRDLMEPYRELFHEELKTNFANRFRNGYKFHTQYLFQVFMQYAPTHPDFPLKYGGKGKARNFVGKPLPPNRTINSYGVKIVNHKIGNYLVKFGKITDNSRRNYRYFNYVRNRPSLHVYNFNDAYTSKRALYQFTEFMIIQYPNASSFEKKEYKVLEKPYAKKITDIINNEIEISTNLKAEYGASKIKEFKMMVKTYRLNLIEEYLNKKNELAGPEKLISDREKEEIDFITSYHGEDLTKEWEWVKNISMVYIVDNNREDFKNKKIVDELKYSLRSIEMYLPWFKGKIYLISQNKNNDGLSWINTKNDRIEIINYRDIIPEESYPTLNRHVIEMYLDKIPNLTEKFIYLKSNHYFRNYTHPRFFFSKEFYPKYNFKDALPIDRKALEKHSNNSFIYTYKAIVKFFGDSYINTFRHHTNAPYVLYRDLFNPARELFSEYVKKTKLHKDYKKMDMLPIYMVQNYNIYGAAQPYYPDYVPGYGYVREMPNPNLNPERTVKYYGFDITSPIISNHTISDNLYTSDSESNNDLINEIKNSSITFFSLYLSKTDSFSISDKYHLKELLNKLYEKKSLFED
jgi:hypothetical protein